MTKDSLIIVPCHSVWNVLYSGQEPNYGQNPDQWFLAPFQHEGQDHLLFIMHSLLAIEQLSKNISNSILLFSGSQTKRGAGIMSEAQSYYLQIYKLLNAIDSDLALPDSLRSEEIIITHCRRIISNLSTQNVSLKELFEKHISTEEFALDSFENLIYSIGRFYELVKHFPTFIKIVGFGFKRARFLNCHAPAIDFPEQNIDYTPMDPIPNYTDCSRLDDYYDDLYLQEKKNALDLFQVDWYGTKESLYKKKVQRNPFNRNHEYPLPVSFQGPIENDQKFFDTYVKGKMPWSRAKHEL